MQQPRQRDRGGDSLDNATIYQQEDVIKAMKHREKRKQTTKLRTQQSSWVKYEPYNFTIFALYRLFLIAKNTFKLTIMFVACWALKSKLTEQQSNNRSILIYSYIFSLRNNVNMLTLGWLLCKFVLLLLRRRVCVILITHSLTIIHMIMRTPAHFKSTQAKVDCWIEHEKKFCCSVMAVAIAIKAALYIATHWVHR